jgi:CBS domain-containing protein
MLRKIVPDVLHGQQVVHLSGRATVRQAAHMMRECGIGSILVMENEALEGIITVADMTYRVVAEGRDPDTTCLCEIMTAEPDTITPESTAIEALRLMQDGGYRHLPVVDRGAVVGVVSRRDFHGAEKGRLDEETSLWERIG